MQAQATLHQFYKIRHETILSHEACHLHGCTSKEHAQNGLAASGLCAFERKPLMRSQQVTFFLGGIAIASILMVTGGRSAEVKGQVTYDPVQAAVDKGLKWLVSVQ